MLSLNAIPYKHLHQRRVLPMNLSYSNVLQAITKHSSKPGYSLLINAAGSVSNMAKAIASAAKAVGGIPFVGAVVAAVLQVIGAMFKIAGAGLMAAAGVLVLIIDELT